MAGRYCQKCGQENTVTHMHFLALVKHFIYDIFHFDGKFFDTVRYLFFKPGFVAKEYVAGRRASYLDPIRMYLFTSALFFLIFFSITEADMSKLLAGEDRRPLTKAERFEIAANLYHAPAPMPNPAGNKELKLVLDTALVLEAVRDSVPPSDSGFRVQHHDSLFWVVARHAGPIDTITFIGDDDSWMGKTLQEKWLRYKRRFDGDVGAMFSNFGDKLLHRFPYLLFVSLPFFALLLKLLYYRKKQYVYSDHATFTLYHYIFSFMLLLLFFALTKLTEVTGMSLFGNIAGWLFLVWMIYLFLEMRRFYGQGMRKTLVKFVFLNIAGSISILGLALIFILLSIFEI